MLFYFADDLLTVFGELKPVFDEVAERKWNRYGSDFFNFDEVFFFFGLMLSKEEEQNIEGNGEFLFNIFLHGEYQFF